MSPPASSEDSSNSSFTYNQSISQNPNPNFTSNPAAHQSQSNSFSFGSDESSNADFNFDCSKMGSGLEAHPRTRRLRYPVKKLRRKLGSGNTESAADSVDQPNENGNGTTNTVKMNAFNSFCGGRVGGNEKTGEFRNVGCTFGAKGNSLESITSSENKGFMFGASKCSSELNSNIDEKSSLQSDSNPKNDDNVVLDAERSSFPLNLSYGNCGIVFGSNKSSSTLNSSQREKNGLLGVNAAESTVKPSTGAGNLAFDTWMNNTSSSTNFGKTSSGGDMGVSGEEKMWNFDNVSFGFGTSKDELASASKLERRGYDNGSAVQLEGDESRKFVDMGFVSGAKRTSVAAENRTSGEEDHSHCIWKTIPDMRGKVKLDAREVSEEEDDLGKKNTMPFVFGAKGLGSESTAESLKSKTSECAGLADFVTKCKENAETTNDFQKADPNGVFVFGCNGKEKLRCNGSNEYRDTINHLNDGKTNRNSDFMTLLSDAARSNFKFVLGNSSTNSSAFYKVPLSKLLDEMKSLNINDAKGISSADKDKNVRSSSSSFADHVDAAQNNRMTPAFSTEKTDSTLQDAHKDANVDGAVKCGNQGTSEYENDSETGNSLGESVKITKPVGMKNTNSRSSVEVSREGMDSSFVFTGVFGKENQPSNSNGTTDHVQQNSSSFEAPSTKLENKENLIFTSTTFQPGTYSKEFNAADQNESSPTVNPFFELNKKFELFSDQSLVNEKKLKKTRRKLRQKIRSKPSTGQDHLYKGGNSPKKFESSGGCSPMDFSPYQQRTDGTPASLAQERKEGDAATGSQRFDIHENDKKSGEPDNLSSQGLKMSNLNLATSSAQDGLSSIRRQYKKKYKLKVGDSFNGKIAAGKDGYSSSSVQFSLYKERAQNGAPSSHQNNTDRAPNKQGIPEAATHVSCDQWRSRGNQAYKIRDLSKAEEFYTKGINSAADDHVSGSCSKPLLLCYSNRAATRMSLGRMWEALDDCKAAAALDPNFSKVKIRAANCHLVLGEIQEAMVYYNDCLESRNKVCLDRRFTIEAADGLQKAQKVAECLSKSAELMQQKTSDAANSALGIINDALAVSRYSEKLLEMKGEALFLLKKYDEVIELCEQTLHIAERNVTPNQSATDDFDCNMYLKLWRWYLMCKSHFHMGRLEVALDLIEKHEQLKPIGDRYGSANPEIPIPLAVTIRGLLERKKAGNEAFQSGKHVEAIEHYTAAISSSLESRPFASICFSNRAAAHQALGQIVDAIADCSLAIALDGNYPKAVSRRATLHETIRDYKQAIDDLQRLIALLENQLKEKTQQYSKQGGSSRNDKKELKEARRRLSLMEDMAKKGTSLDLYLILGVKTSETESDIKKAYRKAALRHHPDKVGQFLARNDAGDDGRLWKDIVEKVHEDADRLFKMIGEAYAVLSDPDKRSKYDYDEEIRNLCRDDHRNTNSRGQYDFYSTPYDGGYRSSRQSHFYSSPFGRSRNRQYWQD